MPAPAVALRRGCTRGLAGELLGDGTPALSLAGPGLPAACSPQYARITACDKAKHRRWGGSHGGCFTTTPSGFALGALSWLGSGVP